MIKLLTGFALAVSAQMNPTSYSYSYKYGYSKKGTKYSNGNQVQYDLGYSTYVQNAKLSSPRYYQAWQYQGMNEYIKRGHGPIIDNDPTTGKPHGLSMGSMTKRRSWRYGSRNKGDGFRTLTSSRSQSQGSDIQYSVVAYSPPSQMNLDTYVQSRGFSYKTNDTKGSYNVQEQNTFMPATFPDKSWGGYSYNPWKVARNSYQPKENLQNMKLYVTNPGAKASYGYIKSGYGENWNKKYSYRPQSYPDAYKIKSYSYKPSYYRSYSYRPSYYRSYSYRPSYYRSYSYSGYYNSYYRNSYNPSYRPSYKSSYYNSYYKNSYKHGSYYNPSYGNSYRSK